MKPFSHLFLLWTWVAVHLADPVLAQQPTATVAAPVAQRFQWNGVGTGQHPYVVPLDFQKGRQLPITQSATVDPAPDYWLRDISLPVSYLHQAGKGYTQQVQNPIAAFGSTFACPSLYIGKPYRFAFYPGAQFAAAGIANTQDIIIHVIALTGTTAPEVLNNIIDLPSWKDTSDWKTYGDQGFQKTIITRVNGVDMLETTIQIVLSANTDETWGALYQAPLLITHRALAPAAATYGFIVNAHGLVVENGIAKYMAISSGSGTSTIPALLRGYAMNFDPVQPWETTLLQTPSFQGEPAPAAYQGKTAEEISATNDKVTGPNPSGRFETPNWAAPSGTILRDIDTVPEHRRHTILDTFVAKLQGNPLALANFVHNEIGLTDALSYNENGDVDERSVNAGGMNRDALAVYQEGQGSPEEQCALLVYLLRQAGYDAGYVKPPHNSMKIGAQRLSNLLRMRVKDTRTPDGTLISDAMIPVNYPWVAAYVPVDPSKPNSPKKWVHFFPWLKDTEVREGLSIEGYLPGEHKTIRSWIRRYLLDPSESNSAQTNPAAADFPFLSLDAEDTTPRNIFLRHFQKSLPAGKSLDDFGVRFRDRTHLRDVWEKFPSPDVLPPPAELATASSVVTTLVENPSSPAPLDKLYDSVRIEIKPVGATSRSIDVTLRTMDFHNRRTVVNFVPSPGVGLGGSGYRLQFSMDRYDDAMDPYLAVGTDPAAPYSGQILVPYPNGPQQSLAKHNLRTRQVYEMPVHATDTSFTFTVTYYRHRRYQASSTFQTEVTQNGGWSHFLGIQNLQFGSGRKNATGATEAPGSEPTVSMFGLGDMVAFCMNAGRVTPRMVQYHVEPYQRLLKNLGIGTATPSALSAADYDLIQSSLPYIMGMTYYQRVSDSAEDLKALFKVHTVSMRAHGFSLLGADRDANGAVAPPVTLNLGGTNNTVTRFRQNKPVIDMNFMRSGWAGYGDLRADAGGQGQFSAMDFLSNFFITEISALEHHTIRQFYRQGDTDAISTVDLLHRMQQDQHAVVTTDLGVAVPTMIRIWAKTAGAAGNSLRIIVARADLGENTPPTVSLSGNNITVTLNSKAGHESTTGQFVEAINTHATAKSLVVAYFLQGVPTAKVMAAPTVSTLVFKGGASKVAKADIIELDSSNWIAKGDQNITDALGTTKRLKDWCGASMWASIESAFRTLDQQSQLQDRADKDLVRIFVTKGDITGGNGQWKGMGALVLGRSSSAALIGSLSGGVGSQIIGAALSVFSPAIGMAYDFFSNASFIKETGSPQFSNITSQIFPNGYQIDYTTVTPVTIGFNYGGHTATWTSDFTARDYIHVELGIPGTNHSDTRITTSRENPSPPVISAPTFSYHYDPVFPSDWNQIPSGNIIDFGSLFPGDSSLSFTVPDFVNSISSPSTNSILASAAQSKAPPNPPSPPGPPIATTLPSFYYAGAPQNISLVNSATPFIPPASTPFSMPPQVVTQTISSGTAPQTNGIPNAGGQGKLVSDPVNIVTGQFYEDVVDLVLPGRMPLQLRRNYQSGAATVGPLGYNWQMAYFTFMVPAENDASGKPPKITVAEIEGGAIVYSRDTTGAGDTWRVKREDNPSLGNGSGASLGSIHNRFNNIIERSVSGPNVSYTLTDAAGGTRVFVERSFPVPNSTPVITRQRPYLHRWADHAGNYLSFSYGQDSAKSEYGQLTAIQSSSGQQLLFFYDSASRITQVRTLDGRVVNYEYDAFGDLVSVVLPDGSWVKYEYQHHQYPLNPDAAPEDQFKEWFSTHLIIRQTKPGARILVNEYEKYKIGDLDELNKPILANNSNSNAYKVDTATIAPAESKSHCSHLGRVVRQYSTVGTHGNAPTSIAPSASKDLPTADSGVPQLNAIFDYQQVKVDPGWYTGYTVIRDAYGRQTVYFYENSRISAINDPLTVVTGPTPLPGQAETRTTENRKLIQGWFEEAAGPLPPGAFPGALAYIQERGSPRIEFMYYPNGNLKEQRVIGELNGDTTSSETAKTFFAYNDHNLLTLVSHPTPDTGEAVNNPTFAGPFNSGTTALSAVGPLGNHTTYHYGDATNPFLLTKTITRAGDGTILARNETTYTHTFSNSSDNFNTPSPTIPFAKALPEHSYSYADATSTVPIAHTQLRYDRLSLVVGTGETSFDGRGFPTSRTVYSLVTGPDAGKYPDLVTQFVHNDRGELVEERLMDGSVAKKITRHAYDDVGRPIWQEQLNSARKQLAWNYLYYNLNGEPEWTDGSRSNPEDFTYTRYDGAGRVAETVAWRSQAKADGTGVEAVPGPALYATTKYGYNMFGDLIKVTDAKGNTTRTWYDDASRPIKTTSYTGDWQFSTANADGTAFNSTPLSTKQIFYDDLGRTVTTVDALGAVTKIYLTSSGKPYRQDNPDGTSLIWRYDLTGRTIRSPVSQQTYHQITYDDATRTITRTLFNSVGATLPGTQPEKSISQPASRASVSVSALGLISRTVTDGIGRTMTASTSLANVNGGTNATTRTTTYAYDAAGYSLTTTNPLGEISTVSMDDLGRPLTVQVSKDSTVTSKTGFEYRADFNATTVIVGKDGTLPLVSRTWTDTFGQTVATEISPSHPANSNNGANRTFTRTYYDVVGNAFASVDERGQVHRATHDALGRTTSTILPDGAQTTFQYIRQDFEYDPATGQLKDPLDPTKTVAGGARVKRLMPGGLKQISVADHLGRPVESFLLGSDAADLNPDAANSNTNKRGDDIDAAKIQRWTRGFTFYSSTDTAVGQFPGMLSGFTDSLGRQNALTYDAFGVPTGSTISSGANTLLTRSTDLVHTFGTGTQITLTETTAANNAANALTPAVTSRVIQNTDLLGQLTSEKTLLGPNIAGLTTVSHFTQQHDLAGRRSLLARGTEMPTTGGTSNFGGTFAYAYHPGGHLASTEWDSAFSNDHRFKYSYATNGLLSERTNPFRTHSTAVALQSGTAAGRDHRGRILKAKTQLKTASGLTDLLTETLTWTSDSLQDSYIAQRHLTTLGDSTSFTDTRDYDYSTGRRQLLQETWTASGDVMAPSSPPAGGYPLDNPSGGYTTSHRSTPTAQRSTLFDFDGGTTGGLGIRTLAYTGPDSTQPQHFPLMGHQVSKTANVSQGLDAFSRVTSEASNGLERTTLLAYGQARGAASVSLSDARWSPLTPTTGSVRPPASHLDKTGEPSRPDASRTPLYHAPGMKAGQGAWEAPLALPAGMYHLHASAPHPSGQFTAQTSLSFSLAASIATADNTYDAEGQVTSRTIASGYRVQTLTWDPAGRLIQVLQHETTGIGYLWTAVYDPLGRRIRTTWSPGVDTDPPSTDAEDRAEAVRTSAAANNTHRITQTSHYDPYVEFLEIGVTITRGSKTERWWKVHGPDLAGGYGGLQGIGGLEAVIEEATGRHVGLIDDTYGHIIGFASSTSTTVGVTTFEWNTARYGGYGPLPGTWAPSVEDGPAFYRTLGWRGERLDVTGFYHLGARCYEPISGRFLSPDPLGHGASMGLYAYANGDPINFIDPTGRSYDPTDSSTWSRLPDEFGPDTKSQTWGGYWTGERGNSNYVFPPGNEFGKMFGGSLEYDRGIPNFKNYLSDLKVSGVQIPNPITVPGLTGNPTGDRSLTIDEIHKKTNLPKNSIQAVLEGQNIHHFHGNEMQIVASSVNKLPHNGLASYLRTATSISSIKSGSGKLLLALGFVSLALAIENASAEVSRGNNTDAALIIGEELVPPQVEVGGTAAAYILGASFADATVSGRQNADYQSIFQSKGSLIERIETINRLQGEGYGVGVPTNHFSPPGTQAWGSTIAEQLQNVKSSMFNQLNTPTAQTPIIVDQSSHDPIGIFRKPPKNQ